MACTTRGGGRPGEPLVDEELGSRRVVDNHERDVVPVMGLPQLGSDPYVVGPLSRRELVSAYLHPVLGLPDAGRVLRVDAETQWRPPDEIGHKPHRGPVESEQKGARAFEPLLGDQFLVGLGVELRLHGPVGPDDPGDVGIGVIVPGRSARSAR